MKDFIEEIRACLGAAIYSPALACTMIVPDACGAVEYPNIRGNGERYRRWYDAYCPTFPSKEFDFGGDAAWSIRNGMMHETRLELKRFGFDRVLFTVPNRIGILIHMNRSRMGDVRALNIDLVTFCKGVIDGCERWLSDIENDEEKVCRLSGLIQYRANGLPPHIVGTPLVC